MSDNLISESFFGVVLCHNPVEPPFYLLNGEVLSSDAPAARWTIQKNTVTTSAWGYLIIDGAHHNVLVNNHASNNSVYDIELVGDSFRGGFFTPASHDNLVAIGSDKSLVVKDCGIDNHVAGPAILVDLNADPCF
jgi:hypothetical protein